MINNIIKVIFNLFLYKKPRFKYLHYADIIIEGKAYFLLTWRFENAYKLKIRSLQYTSHKKAGSSYILVPKNIELIELAISNLWKSEKKTINLIRTTIPTQTDFLPVRKFNELNKKSVYNAQLTFTLKAPAFQYRITKVKTPIIKMNYHNLIYNNLNNP